MGHKYIDFLRLNWPFDIFSGFYTITMDNFRFYHKMFKLLGWSLIMFGLSKLSNLFAQIKVILESLYI